MNQEENVMIENSTLPDLARSDLAEVVVERWVTPDSQQQTKIIRALSRSHRDRRWPAGLASLTILASGREDAVLTYQQWTEAADPAAGGLPPTAGIATAERARYARTHSVVLEPLRATACLVVTTFDFATADAARDWSDLLATALEATRPPVRGLLAQHLHLEIGGSSVLNCSQWTSPQAHRTFLEAAPSGPEWQRVESFPGITHGPGARCRIHTVMHAVNSS